MDIYVLDVKVKTSIYLVGYNYSKWTGPMETLRSYHILKYDTCINQMGEKPFENVSLPIGNEVW